jgi:hypothetical protein
MKIAMWIGFSAFLVGMCAAADRPLACNLKAIGAAARPRYDELMQRLRSAIRSRSELADGYSFQLDTEKILLPEVGEWIAMEQLCCPFLTFQLDVSANGGSSLSLRGPEGAKAILREEFPLAK